ncbi:MAG: hypothetical protein ABI844_08020 [Saprospiraceae bacterium]
MITKANFTKFEPIVLSAIDELFEVCIKNECHPNEFLIFLENGHYDNTISNQLFSPFLIGQGLAGAKDGDRMSFVEFYLDFPFEQRIIELNKEPNSNSLQNEFDVRIISTSISMMVYTHFWESKVFQRTLRLLAKLSIGEEYDWHLNDQPKEVYFYIRDKIRNIFKENNLMIYDIIKSAYRSQIRDAFAHSDYFISDRKIYLENFSPTLEHSKQFISYDEFDEIIIKTILLHHCIVTKIDEYRHKLGLEKPDREIYVPENGGTIKTLHYRKAGHDKNGNDFYRWLWPNQF